jgi:hypothetical protein
MGLEFLEARSLLSAGLAGDPQKQANHGALVDSAGKPSVVSAEVGSMSPAATRAEAFRQKRLLQQQLKAQGRIKSAASLDSTTIQIRLKQKLNAPLTNPAMYEIPGLEIESVSRSRNGLVVTLQTSTQADTTYKLTMVAPSQRPRTAGVSALAAPTATQAPAAKTLGTISVVGTAPVISPGSTELPRVVSAVSTSNTQVVVQFSEPMSDRAIVAQYYEITPQNVLAESGRVVVKNARFQELGTGAGKVIDRSTVILTTESQNEMDYVVRVANVVDLQGDPLAPAVTVAGQRIDPTSAHFQGTPPQAEVKNGVPTLVDTDGDGLFDHEEQRGWTVNITAADGSVFSRTVTSDIRLADTDGDGLSDYQEANLGFDPRAIDTDADQLSDYAEFNEIFSNGLAQDTDGDSLDDFVEFAFFKTSPVFADTDGDQIGDGDEVVGNRNPRVSDLPRPEIEVGAVNLQMDVRFSESNAKEARDLETRSVATTLAQSESRSLSRQHTANVEAKLGFEAGFGDGTASVGAFFRATGEVTAGYTFQQTEESASEAQRSYENSLATEQEVTNGFTVNREVVGAVMQVAVNLRNVSNLAYRVKNLQVTAFVLDPQDHSRLTPVATLLPDSEPEEGFTLGPFVTDRGPLIFSNSTIVPTLVESLMANSSGLVFRISNYDIINEDNRNFAFISQEVVERTAGLVIDFGGARSLRARVSGQAIDENLPGDETEIHRVSTAAGRAIEDTNGDGSIDDGDRRITFGADGKEVGITVFEALSAAGLARYEARLDPATDRYLEYEVGGDTPVALAEGQVLASYSTYVDDQGREKIFRIRGVSNDFNIQKYWEILTPTGVDRITLLGDLILKADSPASLNFVQDLDGDGLTADVEYLLRTSDSPEPVSSTDPTPKGRDTDGDGLDDRYEALIGWTVSTPQSTYTVYSSPNRADSNFDTPKAGIDSDEDGVEDRLEYNGSDAFAAPAGWDDANGNGLRDRFEVQQDGPADLVLDPVRKDTDGDGITDATELVGFRITRIENGMSQLIPRTNPLTPFSDSDTFTDGFEKLVGLDPNDGRDTDEDGDGLPDIVETEGWTVGKPQRVSEIQRVVVTTNAATPLRSFSLQFGGGASDSSNTTVGLTSQSSADEVAAALNNLAVVRRVGGRVLVTASSSTVSGTRTTTYVVTFVRSFLGMDQLPLIGTGGITVATDRNGSIQPNVLVLEGVSQRPHEPGPLTARRGFSRTDSADTDGDGLTDYEEFFLRTDPATADTDGDGLDDRIEHLGFALGHKVGGNDIGIIRTDPLDADTDDDLRSDGDEAELVDVEAKRWIVRASGNVQSGQGASSTAYQVYSHPLVADADFDGLVDGEELLGIASSPIRYTTDPNNSNTDGDRRNDGEEVRGGLNPLLEDFRVTVVAEWMQTFGDGTPASDSSGTYGGDYQLDLGVRLPNESGPAGLSTVVTSALSTRQTINMDGPNNGAGTFDRYFFGDLEPAFSDRSLTFSLAAGQRFSIELTIKEYGSNGSYGQVDLGGLTGLQAYKTYDEGAIDPNDGTGGRRMTPTDPIRSVFSASSLTTGEVGAINNLYFYYDTRINKWQQVGNYQGVLVGVVKLFYFIE